MKKFALFCLLFLAALAMARAAQSRETLSLDAAGLRSMHIECGAGSLKVRGDDKLERVEVDAVLDVRGIGEGELPHFKKESVTLTLERKGDRAVLTSLIESESFLDNLFGHLDARINLEVRLPRALHLVVDDGSGEAEIRSLDGGLNLEDGSGNITLSEISGEVRIVDGSGDMFLDGLKGRLSIEDGSGDIELVNAGGDVSVDDGSGDIDVKDAAGDVDIEDGSGEIHVARVGGSLVINDGSGDIEIDGVEKDVTIEEAGSGGIEIHNVKGKVRK